VFYVHAVTRALTCGLESGWAIATPAAEEQASLFDDPSGPYTRRSDPDTSRAAAASLNPATLSQLKSWILDALKRHGPLTHEEMYDLYLSDREVRESWSWTGPPHKEQSVRSRCNELVKDHGLVIDSGRRRKMRDGNNAVVWELV
jgi:hypothetical protein